MAKVTSPIVKSLFYITHTDNLQSILQRGILCHERIVNEKIEYTPVYDSSIVQSRKLILAPNGQSLWEFTNLYFQPRNAMLFRVLREKKSEEIAVLGVNPSILHKNGVFISTGNARSIQSEILMLSQLSTNEVKSTLKAILKDIKREWWTDSDGSKRKMMAESLIPSVVDPQFIHSIYVASDETAAKVRRFAGSKVVVVAESNLFFEPNREWRLTEKLSLVRGDMFFSGMRTLTVSVNCVGVMGKGLASRAKYQFPDVYVTYQDLCRSKTLRMGKPYLYKRESSLDEQLADEPATMANGNGATWFLLFPTKRDWKEMADFRGIEQGLDWLSTNYKEERIESIAMPALGCGLGRLSWSKVGPLMCKYLSRMDADVRIYLPAEKSIKADELSKEFLLRES